MAYVTRDQVTPKIPPQVLNDALDDNGDGMEDDGLFDAIVAAASLEVDGYLAGLYTVPFADPAPVKVQAAALALTCEAIFSRRNVPFPDWLDRAVKFWRPHLQAVGNHKLPFDAAVPRAFTPGSFVTSNIGLDAQSS